MPPSNQDTQIIARELSNTLRKMASDQQSFLKSMTDALNPTQAGGGNRRASPGASPTANTEANRRLVGSLKNLNTVIGHTANQMNTFARYINIANRNMKKSASPRQTSSSLSSVNNTLNDINNGINSILQHLINNPGNGGGSGGGGGGNNNNNPRPSAFDRALGAITSKLSNFSLAAAGKMALTDVKTAASTSSHYGFDTFGDSLSMGLTPKDYMQLGADYRTESLKAIGGMNEWRNTLKNAQQDLFPFTGSLADAAKIAAELQHTLTNSGIAFEDTIEVIGSGKNGLVGQLKNLSAITGQTVSSLTTTLTNITQNDTSREIMMKMTGDQRAAYIQDQAKLLNYYTTLTGSLARAQEIVTKQAQMQSKPAKDRMITSAKRAAIMSAMGMDFKSTQEYRRLASMSSSSLSRNPQLMKRKQELEDQASRMLERGLASDNLAIQNLYDNYSRVGGFDEIKSSNTTLDTKLNDDSISKQIDTSFSKFLSDNSPLSVASNMFLQAVEKFQAVMGTALTVGSLALLKHLLGTVSYNGRTLSQRLSQRFGGSAQTIPTSGLFAGGRKMLMGGVLGGVASMAAGYALDHYIKADSQKHEQWKNTASSALEYAGLGATIGSFIAPGLGTAIGAALGGLAGTIISAKNDKSTHQSIYDANSALISNDITLAALNSKHKQEMTAIDSEIASATKLRDLNKGIDNEKVNSAQKELDALLKKKALLEKTHPEDVEAINTMRARTANYLKTLQDSKQMANAIDESFGNKLGIGPQQFDSEKYASKVGFDSTGKLGLDFASTMAGRIPQQLLQSLALSMSSGNSITGSDNLKALHQYVDLKTQDLDLAAKTAGNLVKQSQTEVDARDTANASRLYSSLPKMLARPMDSLKEHLVSSPITDIPSVSDMRIKELPMNMSTMGTIGFNTNVSKNLESALSSRAVMGETPTNAGSGSEDQTSAVGADSPLAFKLDTLIEIMSKSNDLANAANKEANDRDVKFRQSLETLVNQMAFNAGGSKKTTGTESWTSSKPWSMFPTSK